MMFCSSFLFRRVTGSVLAMAWLAGVPACRRDAQENRAPGAAAGSRRSEVSGRDEDSPGKRLRQAATGDAVDLVRQLRERPLPLGNDLDREMLELAYARGQIGQVFAALRKLEPPFDARTSEIMRALGVVLGSHGDVTPEMIGQLGELGQRGPEGGNCLYAYLQVLCGQSSAVADQALEELKISKGAKILLEDMLAREVGKSDPREGLRRLEAIPADLASGSAMLILKGWLAQDPGAALEALKALPQERISGFLKNNLFLDSLIAANPQALADLYAGLPYTEGTVGLVRSGVSHLTDDNAPLAFRILSALPAGARRDELIVDTVSSMVGMGDPATLAHIREVAAGSDEELVLRGIVSGIGQQDPGKALEMVRGLPDGGSAELNREVGSRAAELAPDLATGLLADPSFTSRVGEEFRQTLVQTTAQTWARQDRRGTQQWVEQLTSADAPRGVEGLMKVWSGSDPVAAGQWLSAQPPGPARDAGIQVMIGQFENTDPQAAGQWRGMLSGGEGR